MKSSHQQAARINKAPKNELLCSAEIVILRLVYLGYLIRLLPKLLGSFYKSRI